MPKGSEEVVSVMAEGKPLRVIAAKSSEFGKGKL